MSGEYPIPAGVSGAWRVEQFTVTKDGAFAHNLRCALKPGMARRGITPGIYTRLLRGGTLVMSDTPAEIADHREATRLARGSVLVNGLGLGIVARMILAKPDVTDLTVVEKSPDVIALVAPHIAEPRLTVVHADAYEYEPPRGRRFAAVWHDIWDDICADNLAGMKRLHRKYGRRADWQGSWCRALCEMHQ